MIFKIFYEVVVVVGVCQVLYENVVVFGIVFVEEEEQVEWIDDYDVFIDGQVWYVVFVCFYFVEWFGNVVCKVVDLVLIDYFEQVVIFCIFYCQFGFVKNCCIWLVGVGFDGNGFQIVYCLDSGEFGGVVFVGNEDVVVEQIVLKWDWNGCQFVELFLVDIGENNVKISFVGCKIDEYLVLVGIVRFRVSDCMIVIGFFQCQFDQVQVIVVWIVVGLFFVNDKVQGVCG